MELTARHLERISWTNLRIPVREIARLWLTAEGRRCDGNSRGAGGFVPFAVCARRWLAGVVIRVRGEWAGLRVCAVACDWHADKAYEELIAEETRAAEQVVADSLLANRDLLTACLRRWTGRGAGPPYRSTYRRLRPDVPDDGHAGQYVRERNSRTYSYEQRPADAVGGSTSSGCAR
jgi:IS5 family transposase